MPRDRTARRDPELQAQVTRRVAMLYDEGPSAADDRPAHVRAASGLSAFKEFLVVVQDDANWLALIDAAGIHALPLPAGPSGARIFSGDRGNRHQKFDLEACTTVPGENGHELIGFGSGSHVGREWILRVHEGPSFRAALAVTAAHERAGIEVAAEFLDAARFYESLRANKAFCGAGLNIEGAVAIDDRILLFQRGNAKATGGLEPADATAEISWPALAALWTELIEEDGSPFRGKIEGLSRDLRDPQKIYFVIDDDVASGPSDLCEAMLGGAFLRE